MAAAKAKPAPAMSPDEHAKSRDAASQCVFCDDPSISDIVKLMNESKLAPAHEWAKIVSWLCDAPDKGGCNLDPTVYTLAKVSRHFKQGHPRRG